MTIYDKKLGEEITKEELGDMQNLFTGVVRLLKITYIIQDEEGTTVDLSLIHKSFIDSDEM